MAGRASLDEKLASLRALRGLTLDPEQRAEVRQRIGDRSNLVVAAAVALAGDNGLTETTRDLEAAFHRFLVDPVKNDKLCRAKLAIVQALDRLEHPGSDLFRQAATYEQWEPAWGKPEDTAPPVRAAALVALARVEGSACLPLLVDALIDPSRDVRCASAAALGAIGSEGASLVLRLKVRIGDKDPDVLSDCLLGLLTAEPVANLALVVGYLNPGNPTTCEAAALALGKSRLAAALGPLRDCLPLCLSPDLKQHVLLAIALLRRPEALDALIELVSTAPEPTALATLTALRISKDDPRLRDRVAATLRDRGSAPLQNAFDRDWR